MKNNQWGIMLQILTIIVSLFSIVASIFVAYKSNQTTLAITKVGGEVNKNNEIETRIYEQRYQLYKTVWESLVKFNENQSKSTSLQRAKVLKDSMIIHFVCQGNEVIF